MAVQSSKHIKYFEDKDRKAAVFPLKAAGSAAQLPGGQSNQSLVSISNPPADSSRKVSVWLL